MSKVEAPKGLKDAITAFRTLKPQATPDDWSAFALELAQGAYVDGHLAGFTLQIQPYPEPDAELKAQWEMEQEMQKLRAGDPNDPMRGLPEEHRIALLAEQGAIERHYKIEVPPAPEKDKKPE